MNVHFWREAKGNPTETKKKRNKKRGIKEKRTNEREETDRNIELITAENAVDGGKRRGEKLWEI